MYNSRLGVNIHTVHSPCFSIDVVTKLEVNISRGGLIHLENKVYPIPGFILEQGTVPLHSIEAEATIIAKQNKPECTDIYIYFVDTKRDCFSFSWY